MNICGTKQTSRTGGTLVELVMVIAAATLLATITAQLLHSMIRQQTAATLQLSLTNTLTRVEEQLRDDVHNATDVEVYLSSTLQLIRADGERVAWSRTKDWLVRTEQTEEEGGDRTKTDYFDLLPELEHSFEAKQLEAFPNGEPNEESTSPTFVILQLDRKLPNESGEAPDRDPRFPTVRGGAKIMAEVARDLRFTQGERP